MFDFEKKKHRRGGGGGSISTGIIPVRHGFYTRRSERRLLSGVCTVKRATKDHKSEQFVLQHCRKTSLKAMLCARFATHKSNVFQQIRLFQLRKDVAE